MAKQKNRQTDHFLLFGCFGSDGIFNILFYLCLSPAFSSGPWRGVSKPAAEGGLINLCREIVIEVNLSSLFSLYTPTQLRVRTFHFSSPPPIPPPLLCTSEKWLGIVSRTLRRLLHPQEWEFHGQRHAHSSVQLCMHCCALPTDVGVLACFVAFLFCCYKHFWNPLIKFCISKLFYKVSQHISSDRIRRQRNQRLKSSAKI